MRLSLPFPTRPHHAAPSAYTYTWLSARAHNALHRLAMTAAVTAITFVVTLLGLVLIPRQVDRTIRVPVGPVGIRPDTMSVIKRRTQAAAAVARVDSALAATRRAAPVPVVPPIPRVDTFPTALRAERDSLNSLLTALNAAMAHAAEAPLPPAFRALAQTPALASNAQVRVWLDSLNMVDKLRAPFGALGAGDPIYVTLTARVNELGRSIRDAAQQRHSELLARLAPLTPAPVAPPPPPVAVQRIDTTRLTALRESATRSYAMAVRTLDSMRIKNARMDTATTQAREIANVGASPAAMLAAAFVIALVLGFSVSFANELRRPKLAHANEAETTANARTLVTVRSTDSVERHHRPVMSAAPMIESMSDNYRTLYLHLAATNANIPVVAVTGDIMAIVATVAVNLAAVASYEARSTLLIDVDPTSNAVASLLRIPSDPGIAGVLAGGVTLPGAIVSTTIGRDHPLDVIPSGTTRLTVGALSSADHLRSEFARLEQRYDFIVIAAPTQYVQLAGQSIIPAADVLICARLGDTSLSELRAATQSLRGAGRHVHGVVLWDDDVPRL